MANLAQQAGVALNRALEDLLGGRSNSMRHNDGAQPKTGKSPGDELSEAGKLDVASMMEAGIGSCGKLY